MGEKPVDIQKHPRDSTVFCGGTKEPQNKLRTALDQKVAEYNIPMMLASSGVLGS